MEKRGTWSDEELGLLKKYSETLSTGEIAAKLGRSRYAVYMKARAIGVYIKENEKKKSEEKNGNN